MFFAMAPTHCIKSEIVPTEVSLICKLIQIFWIRVMNRAHLYFQCCRLPWCGSSSRTPTWRTLSRCSIDGKGHKNVIRDAFSVLIKDHWLNYLCHIWAGCAERPRAQAHRRDGGRQQDQGVHQGHAHIPGEFHGSTNELVVKALLNRRHLSIFSLSLQ